TFASWLMMRGASLTCVAELLGHQSFKMTCATRTVAGLRVRGRGRPRSGGAAQGQFKGQEKGNVRRRGISGGESGEIPTALPERGVALHSGGAGDIGDTLSPLQCRRGRWPGRSVTSWTSVSA